MREALFSMLSSSGAFDKPARVLDLYAGSGALAFEALSRGAQEAVLVESGRAAAMAIRENASALDVEIALLNVPVERALDRLEGSFDIVFLDPPYAIVKAPAFATVLVGAARHLAAGGILVLEHSSNDSPEPPSGFICERSRKYGDTTLSFFVSE